MLTDVRQRSNGLGRPYPQSATPDNVGGRSPLPSRDKERLAAWLHSRAIARCRGAFTLNLADIAEKIAELPLAAAISTGMPWQWAFPTIETVHVAAIATVFGSIVLVDMRLLGVSDRSLKVSKLSAELLPITWTAFVLALITGSLLFMSKAPDYLVNLQFRLKMAFILLAGLNMTYFHWGIFRRVAQWDGSLPPPPRARIAGLVSVLCWTTVIFLGRWIGFTM